MPADNRIRLPLDLPGYEESIAKIRQLINAIKEIQAQKIKLASADKKLSDEYDAGNNQWSERKKQVRSYYTELAKLGTEINRISKAEKKWQQYAAGWGDFKGIMAQESEIQRLHSMSWRLEGTGGLGMNFKGLQKKKAYPRWGGVPKPEQSAMRDLAGAANAGFWEKDFSGGMNKATRATRNHKGAADANSRSIGIEARNFKWMLGFVLMGVNALTKFTGEAKIFGSLWGLLGKAMGFIIDMIILPLAPIIFWVAEGMYWLGTMIHGINTAATDAHPVLGVLLTVFEAIVAVAILDGIAKLITGVSLLETTGLGAALKIGWLATLLRGILAFGTIMIVLYVLDKTGLSDWIARTQWKVMNFGRGLAWQVGQWISDIMVAIGYVAVQKLDELLSLINNNAVLSTLLGGSLSGVQSRVDTLLAGGKDHFSNWSMFSSSNPYWSQLGTSGTNPLAWNDQANARWDELYPDGYSFYGNTLGDGEWGYRTSAPTTEVTDNRVTVENINLYADLDSIEGIIDESMERQLARQDRVYSRYFGNY